ncbi:hypothetical protein BO94DRAFT_579978 [Aspergillus sclerotioniger CBS 115572]|uniref:WW domain-containing protein n=1 Tax=Aspergillus sclerotioniger CBS 115572 TaxID=1450535 RepID=A0A317XGN5_9EURO|nr:hypothetical protein BO94DRAFT_579978 [Aspergillus sclerotioniger CBS 115572]PWY96110.1 hypothetical protein BO94DRAFT_579978 [Aspergillus sclerotioniger CBS 115572]
MPPPPPSVPEGWKAEFDNRYQEWYYVNLHTGQSHWERPDRPAQPGGPIRPPDGPPPSREATTHDRLGSQQDPDARDHDLPEVYTPQPPSQSAYAPNLPQGYHGYPQPHGYNYNSTYPPPAVYLNQYPYPYPSAYDPYQTPHNQKQKKELRKKIVAGVLAVGG